MTTDSDVAVVQGPVYLDASAWVKLYQPEPYSDALNKVLLGRTDLFVSDGTTHQVCPTASRKERNDRLTRSVAVGSNARAESVVVTHGSVRTSACQYKHHRNAVDQRE